MNNIKANLNTLKEDDLLNLILYILYKLSGDEDYSTIGQLIYVLDRNTLLRLCTIFGGKTVKIPTIESVKIILKTLVIWQSINIDNLDFESACKKFEVSGKDKEEVISLYSLINEVVKEYGE